MQEGSITQIAARKQYVCHMCGKIIFPGRQYILQKRKIDGRFKTLRRHIHCDAMLNAWVTDIRDPEQFWYKEDEVAKDICAHVCTSECNIPDTCLESLEQFSCEKCQEALLSPSVLGAAIQSVRDNLEEE